MLCNSYDPLMKTSTPFTYAAAASKYGSQYKEQEHADGGDQTDNNILERCLNVTT